MNANHFNRIGHKMSFKNLWYIYIVCLLYVCQFSFSETYRVHDDHAIDADAIEMLKQLNETAVQNLREHNSNKLYDDALAGEQSLNRVRRHESHDKTDDDLLQTAYRDVKAAAAPTVIAAETRIRARRQVSDWLIAPNTRWCGRGNSANGTYNHLGGASSADKCCRKHDHCKLFIPAMSNRFELFNYRPYTLSHCTCDRRFRTCLKMANDEDANTIGKLFFNMVQTQCFVLKQEHMCQARSTDGSGACMNEIVRHKAYLKNNKKF